MPGKKPDFLDLDNDGNTTEPMAGAAKKKMMRGGKVKMMRGGKVPGMMRGGKVKMQGGGMADVVQGMAMVKDVAQQMNKPRAQVDGMNANQLSSAMGIQDMPMTSGGMRKMRNGGRVF